MRPWRQDRDGWVVTANGGPWLGCDRRYLRADDCIVCGERRVPGTLLCVPCRQIETRVRAGNQRRRLVRLLTKRLGHLRLVATLDAAWGSLQSAGLLRREGQTVAWAGEP